MKTVSLSDVRARLGDYVARCAVEGPVVLIKDGKPVAVLLAPANDEDLERLLLSRSPRFRAMLERSRRSIRAGKGLSPEAFWKAVSRRKR